MLLAFRQLRRSPGFTVAAVLILAIGIGANAAIFSVLNAVALRSLNIPNADTLVGISAVNARGQLRLTLVTALDELAREPQPLKNLCAYSGAPVFAVQANGTPTQVLVEFITADCLATFGIQPFIGRGFTTDEAPTSGRGRQVALLGYRFWERAFGRDPGVAGRTIEAEGATVEIVGVLPRGFTGLQVDTAVDIVAPFGGIVPNPRNRPPGATHILGRLRRDVPLEQVRAEMAAKWQPLLDAVLPATLSEAERTDFRDVNVRVERLGKGFSNLRAQYQEPLNIVLALTGALLLLACANLGGLLLSRLAAREADLTIRRAIGATRLRLARELFAEGVLIAGAGATLGVAIAWALVGLLSSLLPPGLLNRSISLTPDLRVLVATLVVAGACAVVMQLLPIWMSGRSADALPSRQTRTIAGAVGVWSKSLVVVQVTLSVVLLVGAALLSRSLYMLLNVDTGLVTERVLNARIMPVPGGYSGIDQATYYPALIERLSALPGVRSASYSRIFPARIDDTVGRQPVSLVGSPDIATLAVLDIASPALFSTVGIPMLRGRSTSWSDTAATASVAVINESLARALSPDADVIGRHIRWGNDRARQDMEIIGIVADASHGSLRTKAPAIYRPPLQEGAFGNYPNIQIATDGDPLALVPEIRTIVASGGREYVHEILPLQQRLARAAASERLTATLATAVAAIALLLSFLGIYSLLSYTVTRRTRELGVRIALGASQPEVLRMVVGQGVVLTAIGIVLGVPAAAAAATVLQRLLFGLTTTDAATLTASALFFLAIGMAAGVIPALRATRVDPVVALRSE